MSDHSHAQADTAQAPVSSTAAERPPERPLVKMLLELGPLLVFFGSFRFAKPLLDHPTVYGLLEPLVGAKALGGPSGPLFVATAIFMLAIAASLVASWWLTRHLPRMSIVTAVVVAVFGGLTLWLQDGTFIKMKPTIVYAIFALILGAGLMRGRSYLQYLMGTTMSLDRDGWMKFTRRWVVFFVAMAVLNEAVWRTQTTDMWVTFKTFGAIPLTFLFVLTQLPMLKRHMLDED